MQTCQEEEVFRCGRGERQGMCKAIRFCQLYVEQRRAKILVTSSQYEYSCPWQLLTIFPFVMCDFRASWVALVVCPCLSMQETGDMGLIPGLGRLLEKEMATCSNILAFIIPWAE